MNLERLSIAMQIIKGQSLISIDRGILWIEAHGDSKRLQRILAVTKLTQRVSFAIIGSAIRRIELDRMLITGQRLQIAVRLPERIAFARIGCRGGGSEAYRTIIGNDGLLVAF